MFKLAHCADRQDGSQCARAKHVLQPMAAVPKTAQGQPLIHTPHHLTTSASELPKRHPSYAPMP